MPFGVQMKPLPKPKDWFFKVKKNDPTRAPHKIKNKPDRWDAHREHLADLGETVRDLNERNGWGRK